MKLGKLIICIGFFFFSLSASSQKVLFDSLLQAELNKLNVIDTQTVSIRRGMLKFKYNNGTALEVTHKKGNSIVKDFIGIQRFYNRDGELFCEGYYNSEGLAQGETREYHKNGKLKSVINWGLNRESNCCDFYANYYDINGLLESEGQVMDAKNVGVWYYYTNGILDSYINWSVDSKKIILCTEKLKN